MPVGAAPEVLRCRESERGADTSFWDRDLFHSANMLPNEKGGESVFLSVCVYIVMPYLVLHSSQQILRNFSSVHISGVELKNMGQQILGSYPVHFHLAEDVDERGGYERPTYLDNLAIHHCFSRCVAIHGTHGLLVGDIFY